MTWVFLNARETKYTLSDPFPRFFPTIDTFFVRSHPLSSYSIPNFSPSPFSNPLKVVRFSLFRTPPRSTAVRFPCFVLFLSTLFPHLIMREVILKKIDFL